METRGLPSSVLKAMAAAAGQDELPQADTECDDVDQDGVDDSIELDAILEAISKEQIEGMRQRSLMRKHYADAQREKAELVLEPHATGFEERGRTLSRMNVEALIQSKK
jgi:hypothetical protein